MRGFALREAFENSPAAPTTQPVKLQINDPHNHALIERTDDRGTVAYGLRHTPGAHVKLFNQSKHPESSIALSFTNGNELYDDIFKITKRPDGGYELQLKNINTVVVDGKRIDVTTLSKYL